jgi:hypothetical protein
LGPILPVDPVVDNTWQAPHIALLLYTSKPISILESAFRLLIFKENKIKNKTKYIVFVDLKIT